MTRDAFVSYASRDSRETLLICSGLKALGIRLWVDTEEQFRSRATWREAVHAGIASSRTMLIALSRDWVKSPACRYELAIARERRTPLVAMELCAERGTSTPRGLLLPAGAELIDVAATRNHTIALVGARLARRSFP